MKLKRKLTFRTFLTGPSPEPEQFLMVVLPDGVRGFISLNEPDVRLLEFVNDAIKRGAVRFDKVGADELPAMEPIQ